MFAYNEKINTHKYHIFQNLLTTLEDDKYSKTLFFKISWEQYIWILH
jgi:hypothetical protein